MFHTDDESVASGSAPADLATVSVAMRQRLGLPTFWDHILPRLMTPTPHNAGPDTALLNRIEIAVFNDVDHVAVSEPESNYLIALWLIVRAYRCLYDDDRAAIATALRRDADRVRTNDDMTRLRMILDLLDRPEGASVVVPTGLDSVQ